MGKLTERRLAEQGDEWKRALAGAAQGNPYATLCLHCYGRHAPPRDDLCPHESIAALRARTKNTPDTQGGGAC